MINNIDINLKHTAIYGENFTLSSKLITTLLSGKEKQYFPELTGKKGVLFSTTTLTKFIAEEAYHDSFNLSKNRSIRTFSSGEQMKMLLQFLLNQNPDFIILDNPYDAIDRQSVTHLKKIFIKISKSIPIIQIFKRKDDLLPFIKHGILIKNSKVIYSGSIQHFFTHYHPKKVSLIQSRIPPPLEHYTLNSAELVKFSNVTVSYNKKIIIKNINWSIHKGEFWQLIGPNGSGKTTILTMINGDNPKAYGQDITIFGHKKGSGENVWEIKKLIGYFTPSMMELFEGKHSSEQMVISGLVDSIGLYQKPQQSHIELANKWLQLIGIDQKRNYPFNTLSPIEQRLVLVARAMIKHPPLLILDEPSIGLDDYNAAFLSTLINKMAAESNTAILYVSHRLEPDLTPNFTFQLQTSNQGSTRQQYSSTTRNNNKRPPFGDLL